MQWRVILVITLVVVLCSLTEPSGANPLPIFKRGTTTKTPKNKQVAVAPNRHSYSACPTGHLRDRNGICRMIW